MKTTKPTKRKITEKGKRVPNVTLTDLPKKLYDKIKKDADADLGKGMPKLIREFLCKNYKLDSGLTIQQEWAKEVAKKK